MALFLLYLPEYSKINKYITEGMRLCELLLSFVKIN